MGEIAEYDTLSWISDGIHWQAASIAKIHHLAQGTTTSPSTNTMFFILVTALPTGHKAMYLQIICAHHPKKMVPYCVHWTVGSNRVHYDSDVSTKTADLTTASLLFNSVVSTPNAKCMMGNLRISTWAPPMLPKDYAYMCILMAVLPDEIIDHYNLHLLMHKGHVYVEIWWGMYGLPQAGKLANVQFAMLP